MDTLRTPKKCVNWNCLLSRMFLIGATRGVRDTAILDDLIFAAIMAITECSTVISHVSQVLIIQWSSCKSVQVETAESTTIRRSYDP